MKNVYLAGGCFWCITPVFYDMEGVKEVISGYSGGEVENPTYEQVKSQTTGHREAVKVVYDEAKVSYGELLDVFLNSVDPFDDGGQFIDRGHSYTLAVFYNDEEEKNIACAKIKEIEEMSGKKTFIEVCAYSNFYAAEEYHQDYFRKNPEAFEKEMKESGRI